MGAKPKMAPRRGWHKQRAEIQRLQRRIAVGGLLDVDSETELLIDVFAKEYARGNKRLLRLDIKRLARGVVALAADVLAAKREVAERALEAIAKVDQSARWLRGMDVVDLALVFELKNEQRPGPYLSPGQPWEQIIDALKHVHDWYQVLIERFEPIGGPGGRSEILAHAFVNRMCSFHEHQIGRRAPRGRTGKFVRFMEAAWADLNFPVLPVDTLGHIAERLPRSKAN